MATVDSRRGTDFDPMAPEQHAGLPARLGIGPGLLGGVMMLVILVVLSLARGEGILWPLKLIATTFMGADAMAGGIGMAVLGLIAHFVVSALLGMAFVKVVGRTTRRRALLMGMVFAVGVWAIGQFIVLPIANPYLATQLGTVWPFFLGHLGYGLLLASTVPTIADIDAPPRPYIDPLRREVRP